MPSVNPSTDQKIRELCAQGYQSYDQEDYKSALRLFYQAWLLVPKPQTDQTQAGWILTAIGDAYFKSGLYDQGCEALTSAKHCPGIDKNPFVNLRLGQCLFEQGELGPARRELHKALAAAGQQIFHSEPAKYLSAIADMITE